jgi:NAD(P)-dependent dehydrogenase (short-subunit alcohol dehydrogenase family)
MEANKRRVEMLLNKKNAVIYGAGGAIGGAVARAFACEGARVFLAGRTLAKLDAVAKEIITNGGVAETAQVDALDEQAIVEHADAVVRKAGSIDILFNAISMGDIQGVPLLDMSLEDFVQPVNIGTRTQFLTARAVARHMVKRGAGVILTITAGPAREATANVGGFGAACEAIEGLWRSLAAELGPRGVRLICLRSAGSPDTPDVQEMFKLHAKASGVSLEEFIASSGSQSLMRRLPMVAEVANVATIMASDRASAMTGTFPNVTCGSIVD